MKTFLVFVVGLMMFAGCEPEIPGRRCARECVPVPEAGQRISPTKCDERFFTWLAIGTGISAAMILADKLYKNSQPKIIMPPKIKFARKPPKVYHVPTFLTSAPAKQPIYDLQKDMEKCDPRYLQDCFNPIGQFGRFMRGIESLSVYKNKLPKCGG